MAYVKILVVGRDPTLEDSKHPSYPSLSLLSHSPSTSFLCLRVWGGGAFINYCSRFLNTKQQEARRVAMNLFSPSPSEKSIADDTRMTEWFP